MKIDHVAIVVQNLEKAIEKWKTFFDYSQMTNPVVNTRQKVRVVFLKKEGSMSIKLIEPTDETSPIYVLSKRGGGLHHICFECESVENEVEKMKTKGARLLSAPQPGEAFENETIAFLFCEPGLNVELIDTDKRASLIDSTP